MTRFLRVSFVGVLRFFLAIFLVALEATARVVAFCTPSIVLRVLTYFRDRIIRSLPAFGWLRLEDGEVATYNFDTLQLIEHYGFVGEQHSVVTADGHILILHRIARPRGARASEPPGPPVILQHGLMQSSECFVTTAEGLGFILAAEGFDVWLGNSRGNRYSCKHSRLSSRGSAFWDFSIDEHALQDFPAVIDHVRAATGRDRVSYIGFSQGTAQAFAGLSARPLLEAKLNLFVALAPAARARGLTSGLLRTFVDCAPESIYLLFGDREMLGSAVFWRNFLPPALFIRSIDMSVRYLFGWQMRNLSPERKRQTYSHLYSYSSVKTVIHWFQIVIANRFQAFDDRYALRHNVYMGALPPQYPLSQIRMPVVLFYGGRDELPDMPWLLGALEPATVMAKCVPHYEHLDFLWADDAVEQVYRPLIAQLHAATSPGGPSANGQATVSGH